MIADASGEAKTDIQTHAAAPADINSGTPLHADEDASACSKVQQDTAVSAPLHEAVGSGKKSIPTTFEANGDVASLREQLRSKDSEIEFLREEVRAARSERGNVVQISHRMMEVSLPLFTLALQRVQG